MIVYNYHQTTKEYTGNNLADPDPLDVGKWLIPAHATTIAPPTITAANKVACFVGGEWVIKDDYRGSTVWLKADGAALTIEEIGVTPAAVSAVKVKPTGDIVIWNDESAVWVPNEEKILALTTQSTEEKYQMLMAAINENMAILQDAVELSIATDVELERLTQLKIGRVMLMRVKEQAGYPVDVVWPEIPV